MACCGNVCCTENFELHVATTFLRSLLSQNGLSQNGLSQNGYGLSEGNDGAVTVRAPAESEVDLKLPGAPVDSACAECPICCDALVVEGQPTWNWPCPCRMPIHLNCAVQLRLTQRTPLCPVVLSPVPLLIISLRLRVEAMGWRLNGIGKQDPYEGTNPKSYPCLLGLVKFFPPALPRLRSLKRPVLALFPSPSYVPVMHPITGTPNHSSTGGPSLTWTKAAGGVRKPHTQTANPKLASCHLLSSSPSGRRVAT